MNEHPGRLPTTFEWLRRQDLPSALLPEGPLDLEPLTGVWVGADRRTLSVDTIDVTTRDAGYLVSAAGGDASAAHQWGIVDATAYAPDVSGAAAIGLTARYDFGFLDTTLTGFIKSGIFILCTYNRWQDGSGRADYFTREFLYRRFRQGGRSPAASAVSDGITRGLDRAIAEAAGAGPALERAPRVDPTPVSGRFLSCDRSTAGFAEVTVTPVDRHLELTLVAARHGASETGRSLSIRGTAFGECVDGGPAAGFLAESASSFQRVILAAYLNKGLLAIDTYTTFSDGSGRRAYRARDHFFRDDG